MLRIQTSVQVGGMARADTVDCLWITDRPAIHGNPTSSHAVLSPAGSFSLYTRESR
jgi:hypothetical protein